MNQTIRLLIPIGLIIVILLGLWVWLTGANQLPVSPIKDESTEQLWTSFIKDFDCKIVKVSATTTVLSFSNEGATSTPGVKDVYRCNNGALVVY